MKKSRVIIGFIGLSFGIAVVKKMQETNINKKSLKGNAKEIAGKVVGDDSTRFEGTIDQVVGASKEVLKDIKRLLEVKTKDESDKVQELTSGIKQTIGSFVDGDKDKIDE